MKRFRQWVLTEGRKDVRKALGDREADELFSNETHPTVKALHDKVFGEGNHHIDLGPVDTSVPDKIKSHVEERGDKIDEQGNVTLQSGRNVSIEKYLGRSLKGKSRDESSQIQSELTDWRKNKNNSNTKLVLSRDHGDMTSASTGTSWHSCANLALGIDPHGDLARDLMPGEIHHGTLIAMHVHKDAVPSEDGSYDSKDILGRTLVKLHHSESGNLTFMRENKSYGMMPNSANRTLDDFIEKSYPHNKSELHFKDENVYDDDGRGVKYRDVDHAMSDPRVFHQLVKDHDTGRINLTDEQKSYIINHPRANLARAEIAQEPDNMGLNDQHITDMLKYQSTHNDLLSSHGHGQIHLSDHHISQIIDNPKSTFAHTTIAHYAKDGRVSEKHIAELVDKKRTGAYRQIAEAYTKGKVELSKDHVNQIINDSDAAGAHHAFALAHNNYESELTPEQISTIAGHKSSTKAHTELVDGHFNGKLHLNDNDITNITKSPNSTDAHLMMVAGAPRWKMSLSDEHLHNIAKNADSWESHEYMAYQHAQGNIHLPDHIIHTMISHGESSPSPRIHQVPHTLMKAHEEGKINLSPSVLSTLKGEKDKTSSPVDF